jgi:hypothetical protein
MALQINENLGGPVEASVFLTTNPLQVATWEHGMLVIAKVIQSYLAIEFCSHLCGVDGLRNVKHDVDCILLIRLTHNKSATTKDVF